MVILPHREGPLRRDEMESAHNSRQALSLQEETQADKDFLLLRVAVRLGLRRWSEDVKAPTRGWSPDMRYLLSGSADRTVPLWRGTKERELCRFAGHPAAVRRVALSADARRALSGGEDRTVRLWDV